MRKQKRIPYRLTMDDVVDAELEIEDGRLVEFALNYRASFAGTWYEIIRYDTTHGTFHVHRFWKDEPAQVRTLGKKTRMLDRIEQYEQAKQDIFENWQKYRARFERGLTDE